MGDGEGRKAGLYVSRLLDRNVRMYWLLGR